MRKFSDNPDNAPEKQAEYKAKIEGMSEKELYDECRSKIWLSAYASNNPISCYHWQCDYCYDECARRGNPELYSKAHKAEMSAAGY